MFVRSDIDPFLNLSRTGRMENSFETLLWGLLVLFLAGMATSWCWALSQLFSQQPLIPLGWRRTVSSPRWGVGTLVLVISLYLLVGQFLPIVYLRTIHHRPDASATRSAAGADAEAEAPAVTTGSTAPPADAQSADVDAEEPSIPEARDSSVAKVEESGVSQPEADSPSEFSMLEAMEALSVANMALILLLPLLMWSSAKVGLGELGFTSVGLGRNVAIGAIAALLLMPVVFLIQAEAAMIWRPEKHPVELMLYDQFSPRVALLAFVSAVILAPIVEELMFRGILQRWLYKLAGGGRDQASKELATDPIDDFDDSTAQPTETANQGAAAVAILSTSLLFAAVHLPQWPAPIPIFVLSLGLGMVYHETGNLVASMTLHALFNGFSTLVLILAMLTGQKSEDVKEALPPAVMMLPQDAGSDRFSTALDASRPTDGRSGEKP